MRPNGLPPSHPRVFALIRLNEGAYSFTSLQVNPAVGDWQEGDRRQLDEVKNMGTSGNGWYDRRVKLA